MKRYNGRELDLYKSVASLEKKNCKINLTQKTIDISDSKNMGNGSWGLVDFLCNHNNFILLKGKIS